MDIKYVCSFGESFFAAYTLKRNNLKVESYPFDWIFSNINIIMHCLEDNFKIFLDSKYYIGNHIHNSCYHIYYQKEIQNKLNNNIIINHLDDKNYV
jgi:hypothetical protein